MTERVTPKEVVEQYVEDVLCNRVTTCVSVLAAVKRYVSDCERQGDEDFPYYLSENIASASCNFFPDILRHSIGKMAGKPFILEPWQVFGIWNIFGWKRLSDHSRRFRRFFWTMGRKNGKALALDVQLPTPTGLTTMGEVSVGDYLIGRNGTPVKVQAATGVMTGRKCYEIEFSTGERVICDAEHEWVTTSRNEKRWARRNRITPFGSPKTAEEIRNTLHASKKGENNHSIPPAVFMGEWAWLPIGPYTLGAWLGDGNTNSLAITCAYDDTEIIENIRREGYVCKEWKSSNQNSGIWSIRNCYGYSQKERDNSVASIARQINVLGNKRIPEMYFLASFEQRLQLLRGLMDTDGSISKAGQCEFTGTSEQLTADVKRLISSLGVKSRRSESVATLNGKIIGKKWRIQFFPNKFNPFCMRRKAARVRPLIKKGERSIVAVKEVESVPVRCVQVEGGEYLCTDSYILTHNSCMGSGFAIIGAMADLNPVTKSPESVAEVLLCATKIEQVRKVMYAEIERMRHQSEHVKALSTDINKQISFAHNGGTIRCIGSDKPFSGLNPHMILMDEKHEWREHHRKFYDTMMTGSGNRVQPLIGDFTTAGDDTSQLWQEDYDYATGVARGDFTDETYFSYIFELDEEDDPLDESKWIKANPNLGVSIPLHYLQEEAQQAKTSPVALNRFTRFHCNRKVSSFERFILPDDWDSNADELSDWSYADAVTAGIDLGGRDDLASIGIIARFPIDEDDEGRMIWRYEGFSKSFIVDETHRDLKKQPWAGWVATEQLIVRRYVVSSLRDEFLRLADELGIRAVAYDPYNAAQLGDELSQSGLEVLKMPQNPYHFNEPMEEFAAAIREKRFRPDKNDDILRWCSLNMMTTTNAQGKMMPDKRNSNEKIDAAVALLMALRLSMLAPSRPSGSLFIC